MAQPAKPTPQRSATGAARRPASAAASTRANGWTGQQLAAAALLLVMAVLAYAPVYSAGFIWDDDFYVEWNPTLRTADGLRQMWFQPSSIPQYYPLVHTTYWIEYHLWGDRPLGYHVVNVLLHGLSGVLLWRVLRLLRAPGAWLAAAVFVLHPVEVESVAWVTERKNVLSLVLALGSLLCYLRFAPAKPNEPTDTADRAAQPPHWGWYAAALALFAGAMFSKTVVATLPAVILVIYWWKRGRITLRDVAPLLPFFALGIGLGLNTARLEVTHVGAKGPEFDLTPPQRVLVAGRALWFYAGKLAWPDPLVFFYPRFVVQADDWAQYAYPAAAIAVMATLWFLRARIGRGPLAATLIFAGVLAPALGFLNVYPFRYSYVADHFQYHASIALLTLAVVGAATLIAKLPRWPREMTYVAAAMLLATLAALTYRQAGIYHDRETLYTDILAKNPRSWNAYNNLAVHYKQQGRLSEALDMLRRAVEINPNESTAFHQLGHITILLGDRDGFSPTQLNDAIGYLQEAVRLAPNFSEAHNALGFAQIRAGRPDEAAQSFQRVLEQDPSQVEAIYGLGLLASDRDEWPQARARFEEALRISPEYANAQRELAFVTAVQQWSDALRKDPKNAEAHYELANQLAVKGRAPQALQHYAATVKLQPRHATAWLRQGMVHASRNEWDQAISSYQQALVIEPNNAEAKAQLDRALAEKSRAGGR